jgi:hypothetical protein
MCTTKCTYGYVVDNDDGNKRSLARTRLLRDFFVRSVTNGGSKLYCDFFLLVTVGFADSRTVSRSCIVNHCLVYTKIAILERVSTSNRDTKNDVVQIHTYHRQKIPAPSTITTTTLTTIKIRYNRIVIPHSISTD